MSGTGSPDKHFKWDLAKGLVPKRAYYTDTQLTNWEQLDKIEDIIDDSATNILQPFTLGMQAFGIQNYKTTAPFKPERSLLQAKNRRPITRLLLTMMMTLCQMAPPLLPPLGNRVPLTLFPPPQPLPVKPLAHSPPLPINPYFSNTRTTPNFRK